jgi:5'-3' exonuclease
MILVQKEWTNKMIVWSEIPPHGSYIMQEETKKKFTSIFSQIKSEHANLPVNTKKDKNSDILVVDGTNNFIRCWTVVPTLSDHGDHVGGVSGFLTSIGYAIKLLRPTRVIVVFDGKGGSQRRRDIYPEYKNNRKMSVRVNRAYEEMSDPQTEQDAMINQMVKLIDFLRSLPVTVVSIDYIEADDAIAYISTQMYPNAKITIMSGDKDFYQLINERVNVWSPIKKKIYGIQDVINEYGVHPTNFVYYRVLEGDSSDNIDGVKGVGLKTAIKCFPMLTESKETSVDELLIRAKDCINEKKIYATVVEHSRVLNRNYMLMQLKNPNFAGSLQLKLNDSVDKTYDYNKFTFIQKLTAHGMHSTIPNYHVWLQEVFYPLHVLATSS